MPHGKHIKIIIGPDGTCTVDAIDFTGPSCQQATGEITAALGGQIDHQHVKPEARVRSGYSQADREPMR